MKEENQTLARENHLGEFRVEGAEDWIMEAGGYVITWKKDPLSIHQQEKEARSRNSPGRILTRHI